MKISILGAGNVGGLTAMRIAQMGLGEVVLIDVAKGLGQGKAFDMEDSRTLIKCDYKIEGTEDIQALKNSDIIVVTAGLARKPGMTREDLLNKNAAILKDICRNIKELAPNCILIMVTNPLDLMTQFALKLTGFKSNRVFGMGITLDGARFANIISKELNVPPLDIEGIVIGSHGEGMLPLSRLSKVKGVKLEEFLDESKMKGVVQKTIERGKEIVSLLGSGSAYFAPSAAIAEIVKCIVKDEKRTLGVSVYLNGEYGLKDVCLGFPCRIGKDGIEDIVELDLNAQEKEILNKSATLLKEQFSNLKI